MRTLVFLTLLSGGVSLSEVRAQDCNPKIMSERYEGQFTNSDSGGIVEYRTRLDVSYQQGNSTLYFYTLLFRSSLQNSFEATVWQNAYDFAYGCIFQQIVSTQIQMSEYNLETQVFSKLLSDNVNLSLVIQKSFIYDFKDEQAYVNAKTYYANQLGVKVESLLVDDNRKQLFVREKALPPEVLSARIH